MFIAKENNFYCFLLAGEGEGERLGGNFFL